MFKLENKSSNPEGSEEASEKSKADIEVSPEEIERIKKDVFCLANLMLEKLGVPPNELEWPTLISDEDPQGTSSYDPESNVICINLKHFDDINTYGEEVAHWIRFQLVREDIYLMVENSDLEEFLGRLGEYVARQVVKGTELEPMLEQVARDERSRNNYVAEKIEGLDSSLDEIKQVLDSYKKEAQAITSKAENLNSEFEQLLDDIQVKFETDNLTKEELVSSYSKSVDIFKGILKIIKEADNSNLLHKQIRLSIDKMVCCLESFKLFIKVCDEINNDFVSEIKKLIRDIIETLDMMIFSFSGNPSELSTVLRMDVLSIYDEVLHVEGYVAAEYYVENVPNWLETVPDLFRGSYETLKKHVKSKQVKRWMKENGVYEVYDILDRINKIIEEAEGEEEKVGIWAKGKVILNGVMGKFF
ncbi:MAG: hypothetical protein ACOCU8_01290 [Patescibacteria group bacterium]